MLVFLERHFWMVLYAGLSVGAILPAAVSDLAWCVPWVLGTILFLTCLRIDMQAVVRELWARAAIARLAACVALLQLGLPLVCYAAALVWLPGWAPGVLLLMAMPAGVSSAALAAAQGGHIACALVVTLVTSLLAPLTVPLLLALTGAGSRDPQALVAQAGFIALLLVVPCLLAQLARHCAPTVVVRSRPLCGPLAIVLLGSLIALATGAARPAWSEIGWEELGAGLVLVSGASAAALIMVVILVRVAARLWQDGRGIAVVCNAVYMNNGLAIAFAFAVYPERPLMVVPALVMQVPMVAAAASARFAVGGHRNAPGQS